MSERKRNAYDSAVKWKKYCLGKDIATYAHWYKFGNPKGQKSKAGFLIPYLIVFENEQQFTNFVADFINPAPLFEGANEDDLFINEHQTTTALFDREESGQFSIQFYGPPSLTEILRSDIRVIEFGAPMARSSFRKDEDCKEPQSSQNEIAKGSVITGVVDFGIAVGHERFRYKDDRSRVEFFWDMNDHAICSPGLSFGREFSSKDIEDYLVEATVNGLLDEELLYKKMGVVNHRSTGRQVLANAVSHGTQVLDIAAGRELGGSIAGEESLCAIDRNPIIAVQLRNANVEQTDGYGFQAIIQEAVCYIVNRAEKMRRQNDLKTCDAPLVINLSFGTYADRHDGMSQIELELASLANFTGVSGIILPAGNSFQSRTHARLPQVTKKGTTTFPTLKWHVPPDAKTPFFAQFWLPDGVDPKDVKILITPPRHEFADWVELETDETFWEWVEGNSVIARIYNQRDNPQKSTGDGSIQPPEKCKVTIALQPSEQISCNAPTVPCGLWRVDFQAINWPAGEAILCWIERSDTISGFRPKGRQSHFEDDRYVRFNDLTGDWETVDDDNAIVKRFGTVNDFATNPDLTTVGSYRRSDNEPSIFSSADLPRRSGNTVIDVAAEGEFSRTRANLLASGTYSGSMSFARGASFSAALATRSTVLELFRAPDLSADKALKDIADTNSRPAPPRRRPPGVQVGNGILGIEWLRTKTRET